MLFNCSRQYYRKGNETVSCMSMIEFILDMAFQTIRDMEVQLILKR